MTCSNASWGGLSDEQIRYQHVPSHTTLGGLIKRLTAVEREWFQVILAGASSRSPRSSGAPTSIVGTLTSARLAGLMEWQGKKYPATQWPAIIDMDTHERPVQSRMIEETVSPCSSTRLAWSVHLSS